MNPQRLQRAQNLALMRRQGSALDVSRTVDEHVERARRADPCVELAQTPRGGIAGIHEGLFAARRRIRIEALEAGDRHEHLAAHLEHARNVGAAQFQRQRSDRLQIRRYVLALLPVPARRRAHEHAVRVRGADRETVELRFRGIFHGGRIPEALANAPVEIADLLLAERIVERQHRQPMPDCRERRDRRGADALRRRLRRDQLRIPRLQGLKLLHAQVVFGIRHFGIVERVIADVVAIEHFAQLRRALRGLRALSGSAARRHRTSPVRTDRLGSARLRRATRPRAAVKAARPCRPGPCRSDSRRAAAPSQSRPRPFARAPTARGARRTP